MHTRKLLATVIAVAGLCSAAQAQNTTITNWITPGYRLLPATLASTNTIADSGLVSTTAYVCVPLTAVDNLSATEGAHAAGDARTLEGRPGGRGGGPEPALMGQHNFAVGPDVHHQDRRFPLQDFGGQHARGGVPADEPAHHREYVGHAAVRDRQAETPGGQDQPPAVRRHERDLAQVL